LAVAENVLERQFVVEEPDKAWATDITCVWTDEGWLYLAVILDLFSRRVIGWSMDSSMATKLVLGALEMALRQREVKPGLIHHSDRGSQYASAAYQKRLAQAEMICSMSRKGDCWDNAVVESFFGTLCTELEMHCRWRTRRAARVAIHEYMEVFYNRRRRHSYLGYLSPAEYERRAELQLAAAA
jgi:transposase InsO family protein